MNITLTSMKHLWSIFVLKTTRFSDFIEKWVEDNRLYPPARRLASPPFRRFPESGGKRLKQRLMGGSDSGMHVVLYHSLEDLSKQWQEFDSPEFAPHLTVVLMLDDQFRSHLPDLIRRRNPALRLMISTPSGHLPGTTSAGDLALHAGSLGWSQINFCRKPYWAFQEAAEPLTTDERYVVFWPAHLKAVDSFSSE